VTKIISEMTYAVFSRALKLPSYKILHISAHDFDFKMHIYEGAYVFYAR